MPCIIVFFFFQAEDGIRDRSPSRGLGDVYKRQLMYFPTFYPVNEAFYNTCADTFGTSPDTVLSNGAFILTDYQPAATAFELAKNPDYYDADSISLDGLAYQVIKDSQQALMSYQTGALDMTLLNGEQVDQVKDDPEFTSVGAGYLWYISPNVDGVPDLACLLYTSPSPRDGLLSRMPSSA